MSTPLLVALAYLGGVLTIVSPCILPVLPFVFSRAGRGFTRSTLPLLVGMTLAFAAVGSLATVAGHWAVAANQFGRTAALVLLAVFGLALLFPRIAAWIAKPLVGWGQRLTVSSDDAAAGEGGIGPSLVLGVATGLLWAPCAGPILGLLLTGAALRGASVGTALLLFAYAAGAATSLALAVLIGGRVYAALQRALGAGEWLRRWLGGAVVVAVAAIALGLDTGVLTRLSTASTAWFEQGLLDRYAPDAAKDRAAARPMTDAQPQAASESNDLPIEGQFPPLDGAVAWFNSAPLSVEALKGKVVLVDFWTYSCINCLRALPYVRAWAEKYKDQGLVVIGVHAPEFAFEKSLDNVKRAVTDLRIDYPVAVDNDFRIWRAFGNDYWPAHFFIDADGRIRHRHVGEGDYDASERVIQTLLAQAGAKPAAALVDVNAEGAQLAPDAANVWSRETFLGTDRAANFASPQRQGEGRRRYSIGKRLALNQWGLVGEWTSRPEYVESNAANGAIAFRFHARDLHLVLAPRTDGTPVCFRITIDGVPPGDDPGEDVAADGTGCVKEERLYQLVRQRGPVRDRTFEIRFLRPGARAYAFTFG